MRPRSRCPACDRPARRADRRCSRCGRELRDEARPGDLVLTDGRRVPVIGSVSIGRAPGNTLRLADPRVSRRHAVVRPGAHGAVVEDAGSRAGTFVGERRVDGQAPLADGDRLRVGTTTMVYERRRTAAEPGRTEYVPAANGAGEGPRLRVGTAIKPLADSGPHRWVVRHPDGRAALRMGEDEAALIGLLDGTRSVDVLLAVAERRLGGAGALRLGEMIAALSEHDLLDGAVRAPERDGRLARLVRPRDRVIPSAGAAAQALYDHGGSVLLTRPARLAMLVVGVVGVGAFAALLGMGGRQPFRVADSYGLGGLVFVLARLALVAAHELAHALTMISFGRPVRRAGVKLVLIFPYAFVDTSEVLPRRRLAISAAGPACDLVAGGAFALAGLGLDGVAGQVAFQLAFAAYIGAFYNLNPLLDRDGYQMLVELLDEPGLRKRSRMQLVAVLSGEGDARRRSRLLLWFAVATWAWSLIGIALAAFLTSRSIGVLTETVPPAVVWSLLGLGCAVLAAPALLVVIVPLARRRAGARSAS